MKLLTFKEALPRYSEDQSLREFAINPQQVSDVYCVHNSESPFYGSTVIAMMNGDTHHTTMKFHTVVEVLRLPNDDQS